MELNFGSIGRVQGALVALGPGLALTHFTSLPPGSALTPWVILACAAVTLSGLLFVTSPVIARLMGTLGLLAVAFSFWNQLADAPALSLAAFLFGSFFLRDLWLTRSWAFRSARVVHLFHEEASNEALRVASWGALLTWGFSFLAGEPFASGTALVLMASGFFCLGLAARWIRVEKRNRTLHSIWFFSAIAILVPGSFYFFNRPEVLIVLWIFLPLSALLIARSRDEKSFADFVSELLLEHPARILVFSFAALSLIATLLLFLPESSTMQGQLHFLDAAFTAVSAVCVTGLTVLETSLEFTFLGQLVILGAIQLGGLGIMTFYAAAFVTFGRRMSLRQEKLLGGVIGSGQVGEMRGAIWRVFLVTFLCEAIGAVLLAVFLHRTGMSGSEAVWQGIFLSISAFCSAGFALTQDSLSSFQSEPLILGVISILIILGSLSPFAVVALPGFLRGDRVPLQTRLIYWTTGFLLVIGFLGWMAFEWSAALAPLSWGDRLSNAWFHSVTRTAGFHAVEISSMQPVTITMMLVLMLIGGSPGGIAGGMKTTTVAILGLAVWATFLGRSEIRLFGRTLPHRAVYRAAAVATATISITFFAIMALFITQPQLPVGALVFEAVSAIGTTGLSLGVTAQLDQVGKVIIMFCMFAGRIGPLTLFLILAASPRMKKDWGLPEEDVAVG